MSIPAPLRAQARYALAALAVGAGFIVACGGSDDPSTPAPADGATGTATAGSTVASPPTSVASPTAMIEAAEGGAVTSEDGAVTLSIPEGALAADTQISVTAIDTPDSLSDAPIVGQVYDLQPSGLTFLEPITVTFATGAADPGETPLLVPIAVSDGGQLEILGDIRVAADGFSGGEPRSL